MSWNSIYKGPRKRGSVFGPTGPVSNSSLKYKMYKRPALRVRRASNSRVQKVSPTARGRVADLARIMHAERILPYVPTEWTPPVEYAYIAKHLPEAEGELLVARCASWFEANPRPVCEPKVLPVLDTEPLLALQAKYPATRPPIAEEIAAWRAAGLSEELLAKHLAHHNKLVATSKERQKALDAIFAKYPSANKPTPKPKKVIKAVNKKMNNGPAGAAA
jgi:hypothetical protein